MGRKTTLATALLSAAVLTVAGCGSDTAEGGTPGGAPSTSTAPNPDDQARTVVQQYLDAMKAKDVAAGKKTFCPALHEQFDKNAASDDGDFGPDLTVQQSSITSVTPAEKDARLVKTTLVVQSKKEGANAVKADIDYSVHQLGDIWCIFDEKIVGTPSAAAS